ncbi:MAG: NAD(P)/FAD-dependent oxidoreductase [Bacteroidetes bacterium]|nr:NAD(P)/FAD-dependent oxidoreductase [Rhodothermia bacterium]MCX7906580.1 NAD(P)/FAD-dependent oxidoreductase [Bacteroidota bacterium]MDW8284991.1 NAD(P)/FAD-dependent oxidoreductase [Bacteroidota bacterium]
MKMFDVIIVGGGPAGLHLGILLAKEGYSVLLLDNRDIIGSQKICTGIVGEEAFLKWNLPRELVLSSIQNMKFVGPKNIEINYHHYEPLAHVVNRHELDLALAKRAIDNGVSVRSNSKVEHIHVDSNNVLVVGRNNLDKITFYEKGRILVLATGVNYKFHKKLQLGCPESFLNAAQTHIYVSNPMECTTCYVSRKLAPGAFAWAVPISQNQIRVGLMAEGAVHSLFNVFLENYGHTWKKIDSSLTIGYKPIAQGWKGSIVSDRVIAVGEAAGQVKTTTGGGIYYGMLGSEIAAEILFDCLRKNTLKKKDLYAYEKKIWNKIGSEIRGGYILRKFFSELDDCQIEKLFKFAQRDGLLKILQNYIHFDWHLSLLLSVLSLPSIHNLLGIRKDLIHLNIKPSWKN